MTRRDTEDHVKELEDLLDRVAIRQMVGEVVLATSLGMVLRSVPDALRVELTRELRACIRFSATAPDPHRAENIGLEAEERFDRLLDEIEHIARAK